ncbi:MAG: class I SAM-dependent methyltransferase [Beijerinckiaceae bacterium]
MVSLAWSFLRNNAPLVSYPYQGEHVDCPVCGSVNHGVISRWDRRMKRLTTALCDDCGLFFTSPMPTDAELENYYRNIYRFDYQLALFKPPANHVSNKQKEADARFAVMADHLPRRPVRFLDFGCGSGELVRRFAQAGHDAHGFEPGANFADFGNSTFTDNAAHIKNARWEDLAYPAGSFDAISMLHVLEHLRCPVAALRRLHEWLADDGFAYIEVPDMQSYELKGSGHFHFAHVIGFSHANLIYAAEQAGFTVARSLGSTSMIFVKRTHDQGPSITAAQLHATAVRNRAEYSVRPTLGAHVRYHYGRLMRARSTTKTTTLAATAMAMFAIGGSEI